MSRSEHLGREEEARDGSAQMSIPELVNELGSPWAWARERAAEALGRKACQGHSAEVVSSGALPLLVKSLSDRNRIVRQKSMEALGDMVRCGNVEAVVSSAAVPAIIHRIEKDDMSSPGIALLGSIAAAGAAGVVAEHGSLGLLFDYINRENENERDAAAFTLARLACAGLGSEVLQGLATSWRNESPSTRLGVMKALLTTAELQGSFSLLLENGVLPILTEALGDLHWEISLIALEFFSFIPKEIITGHLVSPVLHLLEDKHSVVVQGAARVLAKLTTAHQGLGSVLLATCGGPLLKHILPMVLERLEEASRGVEKEDEERFFSADSFACYRMMKHLEEILLDMALAPELRTLVLTELRNFLWSEDPRLRLSAARLLGRIGDKGSRRLLSPLLKDEETVLVLGEEEGECRQKAVSEVAGEALRSLV